MLRSLVGSEMCIRDRLGALWLAQNSLSGNIPPQLSSMAGLTSLLVAHTQSANHLFLDAWLGYMLQCDTMSSARFLYQNSLSGTIPSQLSMLTDMNFLLLLQNSLSGTIPPRLSSLTKLKFLILLQNSLAGTIPPQLSSMAELRQLVLLQNSLSGTIPSLLSNITELHYL
eukprot:TRINITY_DN14903_c0_g1_i3.p1 TRINITY_DN14903_c0_g1~~TRINITY_DN14903_c0_g1_i3.p1  ORF type:complete len:170 (+),score=36.88 TRINITY_DN14903_c0_g1_i3:134-643(+)